MESVHRLSEDQRRDMQACNGLARCTGHHSNYSRTSVRIVPTSTREPRWFSQIDVHRRSEASSETQGPEKELPHRHGHCQIISPIMGGTIIARSHCILRTRPWSFQVASGTYGTSYICRRIRRVVHHFEGSCTKVALAVPVSSTSFFM